MKNTIMKMGITPDIHDIVVDQAKPRQWRTPILKAFNVSNTLGDLSKPDSDGLGAGDTYAS